MSRECKLQLVYIESTGTLVYMSSYCMSLCVLCIMLANQCVMPVYVCMYCNSKDTNSFSVCVCVCEIWRALLEHEEQQAHQIDKHRSAQPLRRLLYIYSK